MDRSDPISDASTPRKRRRLDNATGQDVDGQSQDSEHEDFKGTATIPLPETQNTKLQYPASAFHSDVDPMTLAGSSFSPQQNTRHITQPTQPLPPKRITPPASQVQVERSSPPLATASPAKPVHAPIERVVFAKPRTNLLDTRVERSPPLAPALSPPPKPIPAPIKRAVFAKPRSSLLASAVRPVGTTFRQSLGTQSKPAPVHLDSDDELDPPVNHSSDEETQGLRSNIKPTNFKKGGRGLDSSPNRGEGVVKESPNASSSGGNSTTTFSNLMARFDYQSSAAYKPSPPADDSVSAYGSVTRPPRPQLRQMAPARAKPVATRYQSLDDVQDFSIRKKIQRMQNTLTEACGVQQCYDALVKAKGNEQDAMSWLYEDEDLPSALAPQQHDVDELGSMSPVLKRRIAMSTSSSSSQPKRPLAKQEVKAPSKSIAEKYTRKPVRPVTDTATVIDLQDSEGEVRPKRRLLQGRRPRRSPEPQVQKQAIVIDSGDEEADSDVESEEVEAEPADNAFDRRLLKFLNECSARDMADLTAQPEETIKLVVANRPFDSLDSIRAVSHVTITKSGKNSRSRPVGEKIVDLCHEMWRGYEAVDELVDQCAELAKPIQQALKGWGVGDGEGELQMMNLDEAHDSGIGTPVSSCPSDDQPASKNRSKGRFLGQPDSMSSEVTLKDYQLVGLNWLNLLWSKKLSCILADDMGLGKTCQVIAFLAHLQGLSMEKVHMVVVPGSTLENWLREFARFAPDLRVVPYYGSQTERFELQAQIHDDFESIDVLVTTYDMAVKKDDNKFLRKLGCAVCVFDEAHALRNPKSDRYEQLMRIDADFRLLLTGTPLQNNLQELVAILAFIMPDLFEGKREELDFIFKHKATTKDADHAALLSAERIARARTMMTPFILRRKKAQVLDLPAKHSRVEWCDLTPSQITYYERLKDEALQLYAESDTKSKAQKAKASSNIMMALRKAAIHPLLARNIYHDKKIEKMQAILQKHEEFGSNRPDQVRAFLIGESPQGLRGGDFGLHHFCTERPYMQRFELKQQEWMDSGKVQKFQELVGSYAAHGDRVLVFSQFTTLMDILEAVLETMAVKFLRLDGSTRMDVRQDMIDQFYTDTSIPVFMLSTRAGGAGINLACANKVIIFDSGFNPQDDIQAENRAHRVGQTREVEVVRLVTRGTIEEQIHSLGESKLALDERVAGEGATTADEKQAEKQGEQMVENMLRESMQMKGSGMSKGTTDGDLKDAFKTGMERSGVKIASKQARY